MKKISLLIMVLFLFGLTNAQTKFGIKGGLNIANYLGDTGNNSSKTGFHVGLFSKIKIHESFALQPELLFSNQGAKFNFPGLVEYKHELSYINLPILVKYYVVNKLSFEAGPQLGFLINAKAVLEDGKVDIKDSLNPIDFAVDFGIGYDFIEDVTASLRYNLGVSNNFKDSKTSNGVFMLSLGYIF